MHISQISALNQAVSVFLLILLLDRLRKLRAFPGILTLCKKFAIYRNCIVRIRIFKFKSSPIHHIGITAGIGQDILASQNKIHMKLIRMSMACSHGSAVKMEQISVLIPGTPDIIISAVLQSR